MPSKTEVRKWVNDNGGPACAARLLDVNVRTVQRWLSGDRRIPGWLGKFMRK